MSAEAFAAEASGTRATEVVATESLSAIPVIFVVSAKATIATPELSTAKTVAAAEVTFRKAVALAESVVTEASSVFAAESGVPTRPNGDALKHEFEEAT